MSKNTIIILILLFVGVLYRFVLTSNGNFLFNMDNARDMVDIREMVILKKLRLISHTTSIDGVFFGPAWYYLSSIPFVVTGGDPYGSIIMLIALWAIGGFFLLQIVKRYGLLSLLAVGTLWVVSDFIRLANLYAFNPNPVIFLTPVFIYALEKYINTNKLIYSVLTWFLGGLFFNFEINFGIFIPLIFLLTVLISNKKLVKARNFWIGSIFFIFFVIPQIFFDLRHQFLMSKALFGYIIESSGSNLDVLARLLIVSGGFYRTFLSTLMNYKIITWVSLALFILVIYPFLRKEKKEILILISLLYIFVPFLGYLILPVPINPWYLGGEMAASLILIGYILKKFLDGNFLSKIISIGFGGLIILAGFSNIGDYIVKDFGKPNFDSSLYKNEIAAIDYVYQYANGQNFKVYTYLPSVYDYPYQYLFWWYGNKKYGYIPGEYAYSPNKPLYIPSQEKFQGRKDNFSGLVFLIKEPDRNDTRSGWEGDFAKLKTVKKQMVGPIEIEVKKEL